VRDFRRSINVALAAVVAIADLSSLIAKAHDVEHPILDFVLSEVDLNELVAARLYQGNIVLQAVTPTFSLLSLANGVNEWPPWLAIAAVVAGVTTFAFGALFTAAANIKVALAAKAVAHASRQG
jgi:hypothetical protein